MLLSTGPLTARCSLLLGSLFNKLLVKELEPTVFKTSNRVKSTLPFKSRRLRLWMRLCWKIGGGLSVWLRRWRKNYVVSLVWNRAQILTIFNTTCRVWIVLPLTPFPFPPSKTLKKAGNAIVTACGQTISWKFSSNRLKFNNRKKKNPRKWSMAWAIEYWRKINLYYYLPLQIHEW